MDISNFENVMGHDNFVWWIGVIEDRTPVLFGDMRYKVRIFNAHTPDLNKIPTQDLPWVIPLFSPNNTKWASWAKEGDWAFGFFQDGMSKQAPLMLGVFPRYIQEDPTNQHGAFTANAKYDSLNISSQTAANTTPVVPAGAPAMNVRREGTSTQPALSYTLNGTSVQESNNNREHVCDITSEIRLSAAINFIKNLSLFRTAREAIEGISNGAAASPITTQITNAIKSLRSIVKNIQFALNVLNKFVNEILQILTTIRAMIAWILSLPARMLALLQQCLVELYAAVSRAVGFTVSEASGSELIKEIKGLYGDVISTVGAAVTTQASAQAAVNSAGQLLDPKSYGKP